jgi:hypothetical protein
MYVTTSGITDLPARIAVSAQCNVQLPDTANPSTMNPFRTAFPSLSVPSSFLSAVSYGGPGSPNGVSARVAPSTLSMPPGANTQRCSFMVNVTLNDSATFAAATSGSFTLVTRAPTVVFAYPAAGSAWQVGDIMTPVLLPITGYNAGLCPSVTVDLMQVLGGWGGLILYWCLQC